MSEPTITFPILGDNFRLDFPSYFTVFGWKIHIYGILIAIGFVLAVLYAMRRAKDFGLTEDSIIDLLLSGIIPAVIGARAYYVIFEWDMYKDNFWSIFQIWNGGLAIYGGIIGGLIGVIVYCKVKKIKITPNLDIVSLGLPIGQCIGRWGNFTNREAMSEALTGAAANIPWRMGLTTEYGTRYYHPCFLYESIWSAIGFVILHFYSKKHRKYDGQIFLMYIVWYGLGRVWIEGLRGDSLYVPGTNLRISQVVALLCVIVGAILLIYNQVAKHHEPEEMWVNRNKKKEPVPEAEISVTEDEFDEELSDAFRMLSHKDEDSAFSPFIDDPPDSDPDDGEKKE